VMLEDRFLQPDPKDFAAGEWSELGSRDMDCIGRMVMRPRERCERVTTISTAIATMIP
jgi:hypothetical protein